MSDEDEPLDPEIEALRVKLMRLMRGGLIFGLGALVLMLALIYRFAIREDSRDEARPEPARAALTVPVELPSGARLTDTAVGTDRLALTIQMPDGRTVVQVVDTAGRLIVSYELN